MTFKRFIAVTLALLLLLGTLPAILPAALATPSTDGCTSSLAPDGKHVWGGGNYKEPWCTTPGGYTYRCRYCKKEVFEQSAPALGHYFPNPWTTVKAPTCTEVGHEMNTCVRCGYEWWREIEATGHDWDEGVITKAPTATEDGEKTYTCKNDPSHTKIEVIPRTSPGEEPEQHPSLLLKIWCNGSVVESSGIDVSDIEYSIKIHYTLKNTGDIPLKFYEPSYSEYKVLTPEESFDSSFTCIIKYESGSSGGGFDDIVYTPEDPKYIGYYDFSLQIPGYDVDDKDPGLGTELCVSNEDSLRVNIPRSTDSDMPDGSRDYCALILEILGDTEAKYTLHTCSAHLKTAEKAEKLSLAGEWASAADLWRREIEELYAEMAEKAGEDAAEAINEDKEAFFEYADAVAALFGDEKSEELLRLRCAEMCCVMNTAPIRLPSSLLGKYEIPEASESFTVSGREIGALNGSDCEVKENYAGPATRAMADTRALLDTAEAAQTDGVFVQAAVCWKSALDETVNTVYKAAGRDTRTLIAAWSMSLDYLCETDERLYSLFYSAKSEAVQEHIMDLYKDATLLIDSIR